MKMIIYAETRGFVQTSGVGGRMQREVQFSGILHNQNDGLHSNACQRGADMWLQNRLWSDVRVVE